MRSLYALALCLIGTPAAQAVESSAPSTASTQPQPSSAQLTLAQLTEQLASQLQQRSSFVQLKTVAGLSKPLRSTGAVLVVPEQGVIYALLKPLPARYGIGRDTLVLQEAGKQRQLQASDAPWLRTLGRLLHSMLAGELTALEQDFHCQLVTQADGWQLTLTPRREPLSLALQSVQLSGKAQVQQVRIADRNGDQTELLFQPLPAAAPTADEHALLSLLK
jgi:hypothetical protein